ncbi:MAG: DHH family phosphoesterase [Nanoarchaeota archaeon]
MLDVIRNAAETAQRPLYLFDDDPDGLCSYLQFYRKIREGKGIIVKTTPHITTKFLHFIEENGPDKIFILDIAIVDQAFIDEAKVPVIILDHHEPRDYHGATYFNPRNDGGNVPISAVCYDLFKSDLWFATVGAVSDWHLPSFIDEFAAKYPDLMGEKDVEQLLFHSKIGTLARVLSFNLKGKSEDVRKSLNVLAKIDSPYDILEQRTPQGKFIWKRYLAANKVYEELHLRATQDVVGSFLVFIYGDDRLSLSKDLANHLLHDHPDKVIIIGRRRSGYYKLSTRAKFLDLKPIVAESLKGLDGFGGGHEHACGVVINENDYNEWLKRFKGHCTSETFNK